MKTNKDIHFDDSTMLGHSIWCPKCQRYFPVEHINPAKMSHPDPTETYRLKCGHTVI